MDDKVVRDAFFAGIVIGMVEPYEMRTHEARVKRFYEWINQHKNMNYPKQQCLTCSTIHEEGTPCPDGYA